MKKPTITARLCETKPTARIKVYDDRCPGFYVSITTKGIATFYFKFWDRNQNKQVPVRIGDYHQEHLTIEDARAQAYDLQGRKGRGHDIAQQARAARVQQANTSGKKVGEIITEYIDHIRAPVKKADGERRPRVESWEGKQGYLERFVRPRLGHMVASEVSNDDVAKLQNDIVAGKFGKPSVSNARHARSAIITLFKWAAEAGRSYVKSSPCVNLPKLDPEHKRERVLSGDEIRTLWWGLDHPDLPCSRAIALALKFELVSMLRSKEFLTATPREMKALGTKDAQFHIPLKRVKKRHIIVHPLNDLAEAILAEAISDSDQPYIFAGGVNGESLNRQALPHAVRGFTDKKGRVVRQGICHFLGMEKWTPHDLRRTSATLAGDLEFTDAEIARCLDHSLDSGEDVAPTVTGVYVRSKRLGEKRRLLDAVSKKLREIIGTPPKVLALRRAA